MVPHHDSGEQNGRLDEIIAAYLEAVERGETPDQQVWLARYPQYAAELSEFFAADDRFAGWVSPPEEGLAPSRGGPAPEGVDAGRDRASADPPSLRPVDAYREIVGPQTVLADRYRVFDVKSGGMGIVYLADDLDALKRGVELKVAIKTVQDYGQWRRSRIERGYSADASLYSSLLARFRREAITWVRLGLHENIVWAMWVTEIGAKPHLMMEYVDCGDLRSRIEQSQLPLPVTVNFALQFCEGMKYAVHSAGMVHRDIKPANVLIKNSRTVKITDFGLAKAFDRQPEETHVTCTPTAPADWSLPGAGTSCYMPPEQFESLSLADTRSDIFSFGATLYELLTGRRPFAAENAYMMRRRNANPPLAHEIAGEVPRELSAVVSRCLQYCPERRYQSFDELADDLHRINESLPGRLPMPDDGETVPPGEFTRSLQAEGEAYSLISLGRYRKAVAAADHGIQIDRANHAHWVNKGKALLELKQAGEARECFAEATRLNPADARAWSNLGWAELESGDPVAGLNAAQRATDVDREFGEAWMCRGCCQRELGDHDRAAHSLELAADLEPHNWKAHANLGLCLLEAGRHAEAFASLTRAVEINPEDPTCWSQLAWLHARASAWDEARAALDRSLQLDPENAQAWALRAWILWAGDRDEVGARTSLERAFELDPQNEKAQIVRRVLQQTKGD